MKKLLLLVLISSASYTIRAERGIDLLRINRSLLAGINFTLGKTANLGATFVALCAHNYMKRSPNLFEVRDKQMMACLAGGWLGDALNNALEKHNLPSWLRVPFQHSFAFSWLLCNAITKKGAVLQDPASWAVGGYLVLNWVDRYWNDEPWTFDINIKTKK
jgi:hypothetical protein